jgi:hypothetical protein
MEMGSPAADVAARAAGATWIALLERLGVVGEGVLENAIAGLGASGSAAEAGGAVARGIAEDRGADDLAGCSGAPAKRDAS